MENVIDQILDPAFLEANPEIAKQFFDLLIEQIGDSNPDLRAKAEFDRAWFTVPGFRQRLGDILWDRFCEQHPELQ
jgi:hypothetical protein